MTKTVCEKLCGFGDGLHRADAHAGAAAYAFLRVYEKFAVFRQYRRHRADSDAGSAPNAFLCINFISHFSSLSITV